MDKNLYLQIFSVRDQMADPANRQNVFNTLASYGYKGFQTAGAIDNVDEYVTMAHNAGLKIIGTHTAMANLLDPAKASELHTKLGAKYAGIGGLPSLWDGSLSADSFKDSIAQLHEVVDTLDTQNLTFTYHHHSVEFGKIGNETLMDMLEREFRGTSFSFCLDTYWLVNAGVEIREWLEKLAGRVHILHLKDKAVPFGKNDGVITELGNGNINFKEVIKIAEATGVEYLCYEQDHTFAVDSLDSAKRSAEYFYSII